MKKLVDSHLKNKAIQYIERFDSGIITVNGIDLRDGGRLVNYRAKTWLF